MLFFSFSFFSVSQILLSMRLLIPVATCDAPCEFQPTFKENQWHLVRFVRRHERGMFLVVATGSPKARHINTTSSLRVPSSSASSSSPLLLLPSLAREIYLDNLPLGGRSTRCAKEASSSRWLLPRWHRVPRLWIDDFLLLPLFDLPFLSWSPVSSRWNFLASATPVRELRSRDVRVTALKRIPKKIPKKIPNTEHWRGPEKKSGRETKSQWECRGRS